MVLSTADVSIRYSGGSGNTDKDASLGGAKSSTVVTNTDTSNIGTTTATLFKHIFSAEHINTLSKYRGIYIHNAHATDTMKNVYLAVYDGATGLDTIAVGAATQGLNATMSTIADENTAPSPTVTFKSLANNETLYLGDIPAGQHYGLWIRRTGHASQTSSAPNDVYYHVLPVYFFF